MPVKSAGPHLVSAPAFSPHCIRTEALAGNTGQLGRSIHYDYGRRRKVIVAVTRTTSPGRRTEEQNLLFQSLYEEARTLPGCEAAIVARSYDERADITNAITIIRWHDDAAMQAALTRVGKLGERMVEAVPGLTVVSAEDYELVTDL